MVNVAVYARVSSDRQKKNETIVSQTAALRERARQIGAVLPEEWVFEDARRVDKSGHSWLDELLREVQPVRAVWSAATCQHLPGAVGQAEVQTAAVVQEGQTLVEGSAV
ncbi:hypothetical protein FRAHR75_890028 [Frankia sp. Hr75.2]|nr:hypothetical protein FRAHR75_890028 [Frankia sp. Hr75.2]